MIDTISYNDYITPNQLTSINLFIDVNTVCNINCSYCFARESKNWGKIQSIKNIKSIISTLKFSQYSFNIMFFGGECFLHPEIDLITEMFLESPKVNNVVYLTNGLSDSKNYCKTNPRIHYGMTLHDITDDQFKIFKQNVDHVLNRGNRLKINFMLNVKNNILHRYKELPKEYVYFSTIYDDEIYNINTYDEIFDSYNIDYIHNDYMVNNIPLNYKEFLKIHQVLNPKDFECSLAELNIEIDGTIVNTCSGIQDNIFKNPLFFRTYNKTFRCQRDKCTDCTGTITTTKIKIKGK